MRNIPDTPSCNSTEARRKIVLDSVKRHWLELTGCAFSDFDSGITYVLDSQNPRLSNAKKTKEEIQVLRFSDG